LKFAESVAQDMLDGHSPDKNSGEKAVVVIQL
jgi:hypothetical protein